MNRQFNIQASPELMRLLSSGIYQNKKFAIIRELATNALDAVTENSGEVTIEIYQDKNNKIWLRIADTGPGLDVKETINLISTYGNSTKRGNESVNGKFGVGAKSPFAYTNEFFIKSVKNNQAHFFRCYKDDKGHPYIQYLKSAETTENSGLEYRIPVKKDDWTNILMLSIFFTVTQEKNTPLVFKLNVHDVNLDIKYYSDMLSNISINWKIEPQVTPVFLDDMKIISVNTIKNIFRSLTDDFTSHIKSNIDKNISTRYTSISYRMYQYLQENINIPSISFIGSGRNDNKHIKFKCGTTYYEYPVSHFIEDGEYVRFRPYLDEIIFCVNPKELLLTGSREAVEIIGQNDIVVKQKINQLEEYIKKLLDNSKTFLDNMFDNIKENVEFFRVILDRFVLKYQWLNERHFFHNHVDDFLQPEFQFTDPNANVYEIFLKLQKDEFFNKIGKIDAKYDERFIPAHIKINFKNGQMTHNIVLSTVSIRKLDFEKIKARYGKNVNFFYLKKPELEDMVYFKKIYSALSNIEVIKNNIHLITDKNYKEFTKTRKASKKHSILDNIKCYKLTESGTTYECGLEEIKLNKNTLYVYRYRGEDHILIETAFMQNKLTEKRGAEFDKQTFYRLLSYSGYLADKLQIIEFETKQQMLKFLNKNKVYEYKLSEFVKEALKSFLKEYPLAFYILQNKMKWANLGLKYNLFYSLDDKKHILHKILKDIIDVDEDMKKQILSNIHAYEYSLFDIRPFKSITFDIFVEGFNDSITTSEIYSQNANVDKMKKIFLFLSYCNTLSTRSELFDFKALWNIFKHAYSLTDSSECNVRDFDIFKIKD